MQRTLVDATKSAAGCASAPRAEQLEARLCSWMVDQALGIRPSSSTPALAIQRIRMVEEWIDAHLADPITLGRLCAVAGVGDRYLESAFRAHRGQTPLRFVVARRLAWVRRSLLESKPGESVTQLAHDAGFVHLGRFAARYRSSYNESPSATLRRSLNR
jgi:AraC-like DNA-binding protein